MRLLLSLFFVWGALILPPSDAKAAEAPPAPAVSSVSAPADEEMDKVEFYLHTIDIGNLVYNNFGHTALRVVDHRNYTDTVYNWGIFEMDDPLTFSINFYRGILRYKLGLVPFHAALRGYQREQRTVWEDRLLLTPAEKRRLLEKLEWNARPENREYSYQYFFDNCSTRPRDYIDYALGGALKERYSQVLSKMTFRDFVREGYQYDPGMDVLLDFGMNSNLDRFATQWETAFHPLYLRALLIDYSQAQKPLIEEGHKLVEAPRPSSYPNFAYSMLLILGGLPIIPIGLGFFLQQKKTRISPWLYRAFGLLASAWFLFGGFWGFMMTLSWLVSGHQDLHHNANQLLFWPIDLIAFAWAFWIFVRGRALEVSPRGWLFVRSYLLLHLITGLLLPALYMFGAITQNVARVSVFLLPPYVALLLILYRVGFRQRQA